MVTNPGTPGQPPAKPTLSKSEAGIYALGIFTWTLMDHALKEEEKARREGRGPGFRA